MACEDCGMNHAPEDKAACIEGHGDDPDDPRCQGYTAGRKASGQEAPEMEEKSDGEGGTRQTVTESDK